MQPLIARMATEGRERRTDVESGLARALSALVLGREAPLDLEALAQHAAGRRLAAAVVEIRALRALFAIEAGDHAAGLALARRASLMARTEGIFEVELFANLTLVRARRYSRQAHLALRIVEGLEGVAAPAWRAWLDWERLLAGGDLAGRASNADGPAAVLRQLFGAAQSGDRTGFDRQAAALRAAIVAQPLRREAELLMAAIDPRRESPDAELLAWRNGTTALAPAMLHGLAVGTAPAGVAVWPDGQSARCLTVGAPLLAGVRRLRLTHGRAETLLAILALAGPGGLDEPTCFARAYGFTYVPSLHRGVFDVLVHRARAALDGMAAVTREAGRLALVTTRPLLISDPRTSRSTTDRVLRLLAERGRASAKEAAAGLGISLRTAQGALSDLAASQACVMERDGRNVTYAVEDSVFSEPTGRLGRRLDLVARA